MKNFILFIRRFFNGIFFLLLQALCFVMIARTRSMQGADVLSSANAVAGAFYKRQEATVHYFGLARENDSLLSENAMLRAQLASLKHELDTLRDSTALVPVRDPEAPDSARIIRYARYTYRTALVVNNSVAMKNNYITLARGEKDGIRKGMAVLSSSGIVGKVIKTSANYSTAISILSARQPVSGRLSDGTIGNVTWEGGNPDVLTVEAIPQQTKVHRGDTVWTTSYSLFAPPDVPIGTVQRIRKVKKNGSQTLLLYPASPFRNLRHVYVVENAMLEERQRLEDSTAVEARAQTRRP